MANDCRNKHFESWVGLLMTISYQCGGQAIRTTLRGTTCNICKWLIWDRQAVRRIENQQARLERQLSLFDAFCNEN